MTSRTNQRATSRAGWGGRGGATRMKVSGNWGLECCPRCGGDKTLEEDEYGLSEYTCLHCGAQRHAERGDPGNL
jgi:hypothetical protein